MLTISKKIYLLIICCIFPPDSDTRSRYTFVNTRVNLANNNPGNYHPGGTPDRTYKAN